MAGAALATVTVTVLTSYLGALGTVTGAAAMSVISTVGASVYKHYLRRGRDRLRDARSLAETVSLRRTGRAHSTGSQHRDPATGEPVTTRPAATDPAATDPAATDPSVTDPAATDPAATESAATEPAATEPAATEAAATEPAATGPVRSPASAEEADSSTGTTPGGGETASTGSGATAAGATDQGDGVPGTASTWRGRWRYVALAVGVFVLVMAGVTGYEAFAGKPLSSVVRGDEGSGTTFGDLGRGGSGPGGSPVDDETSTPEPDSTAEPEGDDPESTPNPSEGVPSTGVPTTGTPTPEPTGSRSSPAPGDDGALGDPND